MGAGMALGARLTNKPSRVSSHPERWRTAAGQTWEAAMAAAKYKLDNLTAIIDRTSYRSMVPSEEVMPVERWRQNGEISVARARSQRA